MSVGPVVKNRTNFTGFSILYSVVLLMLMCAGGVHGAESETSAPQEIEDLLQETKEAVEEQTGVQLTGELDFASLREKYQNAIVKIEFTAIGNQEETKLNPTKSESYYSGDEPPHGSGFFVSDREIVTNAHVVEQARNGSIRIQTPSTGNVEFRVDVVGVGSAETIDLAVLRLPEDELLRLKKRSGLKRIPTLEFTNSDGVKQADPLAIFGYPQSSDELKIIQAKVTGREYLRIKRGRFICGHQFIEVGPGGVVQPGNSGGPALNREGKVVGIPSRGSGYGSEQGWLIPSNIVLHFLDRVKSNDAGRKSLNLPRLGISLTENFPGNLVWAGAPEDLVLFELGVLVSEVVPDSLAEKWDIRSGDIIIGFGNRQRGLSCALDLEGYRICTGRMKTWPPDSATSSSDTTEVAKTHLTEMVLTSNPGDDVTLWYVRPGERGIQKIEKKFEYTDPAPVEHLGTFEKPEFELWGDFVAQDFNDLTTLLFEIPAREIQQGGVLVTFVEPNSLASRRGMDPRPRSMYSFSYSEDDEPMTSWVIIETINGKPVKTLRELKSELRAAEKAFSEKQKAPDYDPAHRILMKERYVQVGYRTNTRQGNVLHKNPAFPIDEALECRKGVARLAEFE